MEDDINFGVDKDAPLKITIQRGMALAHIEISGLLIGYARSPEMFVAESITPAVKRIMEMTS